MYAAHNLPTLNLMHKNTSLGVPNNIIDFRFDNDSIRSNIKTNEVEQIPLQKNAIIKRKK